MKNIIKLIILPIVYILVTNIINFLFCGIYTFFHAYSLGYKTNEELDIYFRSDLYKKAINEFLNINYIYIALLVFIIFIPFLYRKYKEYKKIEKTLDFNKIVLIIVLTFLLAGIFNTLFFQINKIIPFTNSYSIVNYNILPIIISSGILGPILEEFIFRGIIYNGLNKKYIKILSIILTSVLFSLMHTNSISIIYSFALSFLLIYVYEKYKTLKAPIIMHITSNTFSILYVYMLNFNNMINEFINYILLIIFIVGLIIYYVVIIRKDLKILK